MAGGTAFPARAAWLIAPLLALYSAWLIGLELRTSQAHVRPYFSDIEGNIAFHAVNTTISASLLGGAALLMLFAAASRGGDRRPLLLSQAAMFGLLAFDDRFQLHERLGERIGVGDHYVMGLWALIELALLAAFCRPRHVSARMAAFFASGGALFALMFAFDTVVPHDMVLRLSIEDLGKTWGAAMFFAAGWDAARAHLQEPAAAPSAVAEDPVEDRAHMLQVIGEIEALLEPVRRQQARNLGVRLEQIEER